jgi:hypothetical protein
LILVLFNFNTAFWLQVANPEKKNKKKAYGRQDCAAAAASGRQRSEPGSKQSKQALKARLGMVMTHDLNNPHMHSMLFSVVSLCF